MVSRVFAKTGRSFDLHMGPAGLLHSWSLPRLVTWYILNIGLEGWGGGQRQIHYSLCETEQ